MYGRTLIYPFRFNYRGTRETYVLKGARASASKKEAFEARFEPVSSTTSTVEGLLPTEL